ncbi:transcription elongation factor GreA [Patescibacteria group bacterium]|nr:transcription elongation factor GreA [Patescibacteria group bacterium]MBU1448800.1 transcription elongation factor GreA [Patescibacteria group bacterium]MBU2613602.1 transcription elongation factor GreA [Patescibacteria group bacterium]
MRIPTRKSQQLRVQGDRDNVISAWKLQRLKDDLIDLEKRQRPLVVEDLADARSKGDLSENAEYQDARGKLSRMDSRIFSLKERIKNASIIEEGAGPAGQVRIGSTVVLSVDGHQRQYAIVGSQETDPSRGRISYLSPLGAALMGQHVGETVVIDTGDIKTSYGIVEVR